MMFEVLNLPPHLTNKTQVLILAGVTHGPKEPKSLSPILVLLVEELIDLDRGVELTDPNNTEKKEILRACLFLVPTNYPDFGVILVTYQFIHITPNVSYPPLFFLWKKSILSVTTRTTLVVWSTV
jgi:hypothetical protein